MGKYCKNWATFYFTIWSHSSLPNSPNRTFVLKINLKNAFLLLFFEKTALMRENFFSKYFEGGGGVDASEANQFFPSQRLLELTLEPFLHILPRYFLLQLKDCILLEACMWLAGRGSMNLDGPSKSN